MAPLPTDTTGRVKIKYSANGKEHVVQIRYSPGSVPPDGDLLESIDEFLIACNWGMPTDWAFIEATYALTGSNIFLPLAFTPTPFDGNASPNAGELPGFMSIVGRDNTGHRVRIYLLGWGYTPAADLATAANYRITTAELPAVADMVEAVENGLFKSISGLTPVWKQYINVGYNAYWQRKARA